MKYLPLRVIIFCIILPPILHLGTVQTLERYLKHIYTTKIENVHTGDTRLLFDGTISVKDAVNDNINNFLQSDRWISWGVKPNVLVLTRKGIIIYPTFEEDDPLVEPSKKEVAAENFRILNEGMTIQVDISLERSSLVVIGIFSFYILLSLSVLTFLYRIGSRKAKMEELNREEEIHRLQELEKKNVQRMNILNRDKTVLSEEFARIKTQLEESRRTTRKNEDGMIEEIISLEEKIEKIHALYDEQQEENRELKEIIDKYKRGELKTDKQKEKSAKMLTRRFKTLYKNIGLHPRAVLGFSELTEDMQIKAEEVLLKMDMNPGLVKVKRKVLMKKNPDAVFEIVFSYNGRIYFRKEKGNRTQILSIGTKNSQEKDLTFLDTL